VAGWLEWAEAADAEEDARHGADRRGDEMPDWVADKTRRLARIRAAKAALEAEAAAPLPPDDESGPGPSSGTQRQGRPLRAKDGGPPDRAQRNFTDPDSRIQPTRDGSIQGYNAQAAVDAGSQAMQGARSSSPSASSQGPPTTRASCRWPTRHTAISGAVRAGSQPMRASATRQASPRCRSGGSARTSRPAVPATAMPAPRGAAP